MTDFSFPQLGKYLANCGTMDPAESQLRGRDFIEIEIAEIFEFNESDSGIKDEAGKIFKILTRMMLDYEKYFHEKKLKPFDLVLLLMSAYYFVKNPDIPKSLYSSSKNYDTGKPLNFFRTTENIEKELQKLKTSSNDELTKRYIDYMELYLIRLRARNFFLQLTQNSTKKLKTIQNYYKSRLDISEIRDLISHFLSDLKNNSIAYDKKRKFNLVYKILYRKSVLEQNESN